MGFGVLADQRLRASPKAPKGPLSSRISVADFLRYRSSRLISACDPSVLRIDLIASSTFSRAPWAGFQVSVK